MQRAIERHQQGEVQIIPIIIRPVHWQALLGQFQALPPDGKPIIDLSWHTQDRAWFEVAEGIRLLLEQSPTKQPSAPTQHMVKPSPSTTLPKTIQNSPLSGQRWLLWRIAVLISLICVVLLAALVAPSLLKNISLLASQSSNPGGGRGNNNSPAGNLPPDTTITHLTGRWRSIPDQTLGRADNFTGLSASSANAIWAVGNFDLFSTSSEPSGGFMARWNGTQWLMTASPAPSPQGDTLSAVVSLSETDAWAVGYYVCVCTGYRVLMDHWDGASWKIFRGPNKTDWNQVLTAVAGSASNDVWAVGYYITSIATLNTQPFIEHWNGTSWSLVDSPLVSTFKGGLPGVAAIAPNDAWAIGDANAPIGGKAMIEHWDGHTWNMTSYPSPSHADRIYFNSITRIAGTNQLWLVGSYSTGPGTSWQTLTERYDGTQWIQVASANVTGQNSVFTSVSALAANNVWAVGYQGTHNLNQGKTLTEHWNGANWEIVDSPNTSTEKNNDLAAVAMIPGTTQVFAVGTNEYANRVGGFSTFSERYS